ncbi:Kelch domain-containing protein 1 [Choanephora cucurbitarum]|uniref:Kelch domain-containing protein 1 n=1 Tax=Choanephora cucurbitarum TaxID=101091 RepID=A0A1C7N0N6_9FUNG|nr:Kelch domain-containing protein 1 [Choanephora cucurbitarum]
MVLLKLAVALLATASTVRGQSIARSGTECAYLTGKVYCFFGSVVKSATESTLENVINVLDLTNATGKSATELDLQWRPVSSNTNGVDITARQLPQSAAVGDGRRIVFTGGYVPSAERLQDDTIIYDAVENKWSKGASYTEPPYGTRQIYYGSGVYVPDRGLAVYGGFEEFINPNWTTPSSNVTAFNFANNKSRTIGYTQVAFFNVDSINQPWSIPVPLSTWTTPFIAFHKSVYDPLKHRILFMGGETRLNDQNNYNTNAEPFPFTKAWTFDTVNNSWLTIDLRGDAPAGARYYHSLTLAPSTGRDVILFGGESDSKALNDYCFTLNLDTNTWKKINIDAPAGTVLARSRHSAVLTTNDTLLILWGLDANRAGISSLLMLNVSDPYAITISNKYFDPNPSISSGNESTVGNTGNSENATSGDSQLSGSAKGGIAAGCIAAAGLIVAAIFFRRKRAQKNKNNLEHSTNFDHTGSHINQEAVPIEVDWDKLEEKYTEVPMQSTQHYQAHSETQGSDMGSTIIRGYSPRLNNETTGASLMNPNSVEDEAAYGGGHSQPMVLKPDVGHNV